MGGLNLSGRTVVVTGASQGIGAAIAEAGFAAGMNLGLCARGECPLAGRDGVYAARLDIRDEPGVIAFSEEVEKRFGAIDLWINNAGALFPMAPLRDVDVEEFRQHIDVNLTGAFIGTRTFIRHRRGRGGGGVLINISSGAAWAAYEGWAAYCAGKAGLERMTEVVAAEEVASGLRAYSVAPGVVDTAMQSHIRATSPDQFPAVDRFLEMKRENSFNSTAYVAKELFALAFDPTRKADEIVLRLDSEFEAD